MIFFSIISCSYGSLSNKKLISFCFPKADLNCSQLTLLATLPYLPPFTAVSCSCSTSDSGTCIHFYQLTHVSPPDCISPGELQLLAWAQVLIHLPKIGSWWSPCAGVLWRFKKQWFILLVIFCTEGSLAN